MSGQKMADDDLFSEPTDPNAWGEEGWEGVSEDDGDPVNLENETPFFGVYRGVKVLPGTAEDGSAKDWNLYLFTDAKDNQRSIAGNYRLDEAMPNIAVGTPVKIVHHGTRQLQGGRSLHRISVYQKK